MSEISIALTTYNGGRYLRQQIESLMAQTMPFDELIICDDTSTDETKRYSKSILIKILVSKSIITRTISASKPISRKH